MRIDDLNRMPLAQNAEKAEPTAGKRPLEGDSSSAGRAADQADVSKLAQALGTRDPKRLEQLKLEVESGNYNVPAEELAKTIIESHGKW